MSERNTPKLDTAAVQKLAAHAYDKALVGGKKLTLAFAGVFIASTTLDAKPLLVWEHGSSYPRYYVPTESLHADIKAYLTKPGSTTDSHLDESSTSSLKLEAIETVRVESSGTLVVIERLHIGSRSTTWVRYIEGPLQGYVRFERSELDDWFENGAIFAGIKNPHKRIDTTPISSHILVKVNGVEVAESNAAVILNETGLNDAYYLPATSIKDWSVLTKSDLKTACPYKGEASYYHLTVKGQTINDAIWYYLYPTHESDGIRGLISFYNREGVEILVDGIKV